MPGGGEHHQAVVIGAGAGGLATAAMLMQSGVETLVLERDRAASRSSRTGASSRCRPWSPSPDLACADERTGRPLAMGGQEPPGAPGLHFVGYRNPMSGMFWEMSWEARRVAKAATALALPAERARALKAA